MLHRNGDNNYVLPNFLGIGAQKSGTTWLHNMLIQHPQIFLPSKAKELHFFDNEHNFVKGRSWYEEYFADYGGQAAVGEFTPGYMWSDETLREDYEILSFRHKTPVRVREALGHNLKFIVLLRNPVKRAVSAYFHHIKRGKISVNEKILDVGKKDGIIHMGFYRLQLRAWFDTFGEENFHITSFESAVENKYKYLEQVLQFLEVSGEFMPENVDAKYQINSDYYAGPDGYHMRQDGNDMLQITNEEISELTCIYQDENELLSGIVDVSAW